MPASAPPWHTLAPEAAAERLGASPRTGLSEPEARERLSRSGPNRLPQPPVPGFGRILLRQFANPLVLVLLGAAGLALVVGKGDDVWLIVGLLALNAGLGAVQEHRAHNAIQALRRLTSPEALVLRDGSARRLPSEQVVPGDVLVLEAGDSVPADARLLDASSLKVDEAALTGESEAVTKHAEALAEAELPLGDRKNMVYAGSAVLLGRARALVTATGGETVMGGIASAVGGASTVPPVQRRLERFSRRLLVGLSLGLALVSALGLARGLPPFEMLYVALSLAVATVPEGLPLVVTVLFALGTRRMAARRALVRALPAVEALGSATVIASDKTGTLTRNELAIARLASAERLYAPPGAVDAPPGGEAPASGGEGLPPAPEAWQRELARLARACNDARPDPKAPGRYLGDPTETALLAFAERVGASEEALPPRTHEVPFESARRWMAVRLADGTGAFKGAPEKLLPRATHALDPEGDLRELTPAGREAWAARAHELAGGAYRVLALARAAEPLQGGPGFAEAAESAPLVLVGLVGAIDPPREGAREALAACEAAGVRVQLVTGDHPETARAIAETLGLLAPDAPPQAVVTGRELDALRQEPAAWAARATGATVLARVSPEDKLRLVKAHQAAGEVVAMTGDGVNDAPALASADIGVAMGASGTEVAKGAAAVVLGDDHLLTLVSAIEEGRGIGANLRKVLQYLMTTAAAHGLLVTGALALGLPLPLAAAQILWVNLAADGVFDKALALEPTEPHLMREGPRPPAAPLIGRGALGELALASGWMAACTLGVFAWALTSGRPEAAAQTLAFHTLVLFQAANALAVRSRRVPLWRAPGSRAMGAALAVGLALHAGALYAPPLQRLLGTVGLTPFELGLGAAVALTLLGVSEASEAVSRRRRGLRVTFAPEVPARERVGSRRR